MTPKEFSFITIEFDVVTRRHRLLFASFSLFGFVSFMAYRALEGESDSIVGESLIQTMRVLHAFDCLSLPRSNLELNQIMDNKGAIYAFVATTMEAFLSLFGIFAVIFATKRSEPIRGAKLITSSTKRVVASLVIFLVALTFRPAHFTPGSVLLNYVDNSGFYFIREGAVIAIGYYNLYFLVTNVWFSIRSR